MRAATTGAEDRTEQDADEAPRDAMAPDEAIAPAMPATIDRGMSVRAAIVDVTTAVTIVDATIAARVAVMTGPVAADGTTGTTAGVRTAAAAPAVTAAATAPAGAAVPTIVAVMVIAAMTGPHVRIGHRGAVTREVERSAPAVTVETDVPGRTAVLAETMEGRVPTGARGATVVVSGEVPASMVAVMSAAPAVMSAVSVDGSTTAGRTIDGARAPAAARRIVAALVTAGMIVRSSHRVRPSPKGSPAASCRRRSAPSCVRCRRTTPSSSHSTSSPRAN